MTLSLTSNIACFVLVPLLALGCEQSPSPPGGSYARDSAGIRIVENTGSGWAVPWRVDGEPLLTIGSVQGNPDQELDQVTGAVRLADHRVVVANGGRLELLFYDEGGRLLARTGRRGGGPGEFQSLEWISRYGADSVLALDLRSHRVSYFDADGNFGHSVRLAPSDLNPAPRPVGAFGDGSLLTTQGA